MIKVLRSPSVIFVFEEANLRVRVCDEFLWELGVKVRPRQASVLGCVVLAGTSKGLVGLRVLEGARCRCCGAR